MFERIARSVRSKLLLLIVAVTFIALVISGASLLIYEAQTYRERWTQDLEAQADILGRSSSAAIVFRDERVARENLELLRVRPAIVAAAIYNEQGALFASFARTREDEVPATIALGAGIDIRGEHITVIKPIVQDSDTRGAVYLRARYGLADRIRSYAAILSTVMVLSLVAAVSIGLWLQKRITGPIVAVAQTARKVVATRDFSLRVTKTTSDESGDLVEAFNTLLSEIGARSEALAAADRMKDQFLATLAHELRNPLAPLSNALQILKTARDRPELTASAQSMMERQLRQMVRLIDDLLDVSRITTGKLALRRESVGLSEVLQNAIEIARPVIDARHHQLLVDIPEDEIRLDADGARLAQVFSNLLNNAAKYTDEGGHIELHAQRTGDTVVVQVVDDGIGIAPGLLPEMFKMFTQADSAIDRRVQSGLGVGLALAKRLVEMHGGIIEAESAGLGCGSRFSVRLPVCMDVQSKSTPAPDAGVTTEGYRIVIIEDNVDFATSFATILRDLGNDVRVAHDGVEGLREVGLFSPHVAFVDIGLPGMNGYEVAQQLRRAEENSTVLLVAVTGWGQDSDKARAIAAGFDLHILKPLDPARLPDIFRLVAARQQVAV